MKTVTVKGLEIGRGMPKVIVPVMEKNLPQALEAAGLINRSPADMIEMRLDALDEWQDEQALMEILGKVREACGSRPLLVTLRTSREGGLAVLSNEDYEKLILLLSESGLCDLVDIEASRAGHLIPRVKENGTKIVLSHHDFEKTPSENEIFEVMRQMAGQGADIAKVAYMAGKEEDAEALLKASRKASYELDVPILAISMGEAGKISRISAQVYGSCMTFASLNKSSAPGQLDVFELKRLMNGINKLRQAENLLYLIGFMGTGKSSVSRELGRLTGQIVYEMDDMIEGAAGCSIKEIFGKEGEDGFRKRETDLLRYLSRQKGGIVSCGGGLPLKEENRRILRMTGNVCLLTAEAETICLRLAGEIENRPVLQGEGSCQRIEKLLEERNGCYQSAADNVIITDNKNSFDLALEILLTVENDDEVV